MTEEWRKWCRLCASYKQADHSIFDSNGIDGLTDKIKKYLSVTVDNTFDFPIVICAGCLSRLLSFHHYAQRCLRVQAMFNALHFDNSDSRIDDIRENFLETEVNEMKNNQHPMLEDGTQIEKNYEMVPIVSDITVTSNSMKTQKKSVSYGKSRVKRRPKKSVQTIPRIRIRAIPTPQEQKSLESQEKNEDVLDNSNSSQDSNEYNSKVPDEIKKSTKRKTKIPLKHCKVMSPTIQIKDNEDTNGEHNERLSERGCSDNDPVADVGKQKRKMKKSELKALLPSLYHFQCHICEYICKNWNSLRTHCKDLHQTVAQVTCVCGKLLMTRTAIIEHRSKHTDNTVYRCDKCEKTFHRKSLLNLHVMSHLPKEEQPFVCCKCARRFHCEALLRNHERVHLPKEERLVFPCHLCHKKFSSKSAVSAHLKAIHLGERPFVCDQCGHSFTSKGILQEHLTIHSDDAPWNCTKCNKNFKTKYRLKIHMDTHRETPYQCPKCPVQLSTRRTLRMHLVVHRDTKAYQCSTCGKAFRRAKDLKNHNNLHTGKRPYTCPFCARTFANGSNCRSHKRRMHPEELQLYEASLLLKNDTTRNNISPNTFQSEEDNKISLNIKEDDHNIINLSTASSLLSEERKTNFPLNFNPPIPSSSLLTFAAARNLSMMDVGRRDYSNTRHMVHQNLLSRNSFNQQLMAFPIDQHYYSSNHEPEHSPTSVPAFPGNPYIHHQQLIYNRASSNN